MIRHIRSGGRALLPLVVAVTLACGGARPSDVASPPAGGQFVTAAQIRQSGASNAWEALKFTVRTHRFAEEQGTPVRIRSARGQGSMVLREEPFVYLDGARLTDITLLRMIPAHNLYSIQVLTGPDATTYFGTSAVAGVILLETTLGAEGDDTVSASDTFATRTRAAP
jgi:hypothetical protein